MALFGQYAETVALYSLLANLFLFVIAFVTGWGRRVLLRMRQRLLHKRGGYVNTMFVSKNNTAIEVFKKVAPDKSLHIAGDIYAIDRTRTVLFDGIPTMLHVQGHTEPLDWRDPTNAMSTGELAQIIENNKREGLVEMLKKYFPYVLIIVVVCVGAVAASLYFNWHIYDAIVQQAATIATRGP